MADKLFPFEINPTDLTHAAELQKAAESIRQVRNGRPDGMTEEHLASRRRIVDIAEAILISERDRAIDNFVSQWPAYANSR